MNQFENKTDKVKSVNLEGAWRDLWKYTVEMENGDKGTYFSKSDKQAKFNVGEEVKYLWDEPKNRIKYDSGWDGENTTAAKQNVTYATTSNTTRELSIIRQSSLKVALDFIAIKGGELTDILDTADILTNWVQTGDKPQKTDSNDDLPF